MPQLTPLRPALFLTLTAAALLLDGSSSANDPTAPVTRDLEGELIVHEWGTFTSYSGSDGARLEFRPLVEHDLPEFVYDYSDWTGANLLIKQRLHSRQRMETPVTYFYTDRLRDVNVRVGFPDGVLTEYYPPPRRIEPDFSARLRQVPSHELRGGLLDWGDVTLIPQSALQPDIDRPELAEAIAARAMQALPPGGDPEPELYTGDHYYFARETDSAMVHVRLDDPSVPAAASENPFAGLRTRGDFFEKFLFYRGIGNFALPVTVESPAAGGFVINNRGSAPLTGLILVSVKEGAIRFTRLDDLAGESRRVIAPLDDTNSVTGADAFSVLSQMMQTILVEQGLYEKEAIAMTRTWDVSWFHEEGTRLLYVVPRALTDTILPLTVEPVPQETVRVLVGRLEILPQSEEQRIHAIVSASAAGRQLYYESIKEREAAIAAGAVPTTEVAPEAPGVPESIAALGRFAEPALTRIEAITADPAVRDEARYLIELLQASDG